MKLERGFLRNKIAKRVVWLLLLSALTPIIAITIVFVTHVSDLLTKEANSQLHRESKLYGMSVFDKILLVEDKLKLLAPLVNTKTDSEVININSPGILDSNNHSTFQKDNLFNSIYIDKQTANNLLIGEFKGSNKPFLYTETGSDGATRTFMRLILDIQNETAKSIVADINSDFLWGRKDRLPFSTFLCVIEDKAKIVFCSEPVKKEFLNKVNSVSVSYESSNFKWVHQGDKHLAVVWDFFINSRYNAPDWKIVTSKPEEVALSPLRSFNKIMPLIIVLSLLIVLFLSFVRIRKTMVPLERLIQGTRQILSNERGKPIQVESDDEFGVLTVAFNNMTEALRKQFKALTVLSEIDRLILSNPALDKVLIVVLNRAHEIIPCDLLAVTLVSKNKNNAITYISEIGTKKQPVIVSSDIPDDELNFLADHDDPITINLEKQKWNFIEYLSDRNISCAHIFKVIFEDKPRAIFALSNNSTQFPPNIDLGYVREIVDRLAVALVAADRDEKLYEQAHFDPLTSLPNRQLMYDRLEQNILQSRREKQSVGMLYIDIDRFKYINDSLGHSAGDELLKQIAISLKNCIRNADTVSRLSGDEFVIILPNITNSKDVGHIAENIVKTISNPFTINSREVFVTPSIGIAFYPDDATNKEDLLKKADSAMYRAKDSGRGKYVFFEERMNVEDTERIEIERDLRKALDNGELELLYQPQLELKTGIATGVEVLVRWNHPLQGVISPDYFIPVAEDTGLIESIGEWILQTSCNQFSEWHKQGFCLEYMAVNISSRQFLQPNFLDVIRNTLLDNDIQPQSLELEITESILMSDQVDAQHLFDEFVALGVKIAIDDFGTGYSSLSYLQRFPVDTLKIDRIFTKEILANQSTAEIISSIITLAHALNMKVVAEGIETKEQSEILLSRNCNFGQGYYFSEPLTIEKLSEYLSNQKSKTDLFS